MDYPLLVKEVSSATGEVSESVEMLSDMSESHQMNLITQNFDHLSVSNNSNDRISYASIVKGTGVVNVQVSDPHSFEV